MLDRHPDIYLSPMKNLKYFNADWRSLPKRRLKNYTFQDYSKGVHTDNHLVTNIDSYLEYFSDAKQEVAIGEISPGYISLMGTAKRIFDFNPKMKLIAVLRNPVDRAYSQFNHYRSFGYESCTNFLEVVASEDLGRPLIYNEEFLVKGNIKGYLHQGMYFKKSKPVLRFI